MTCSNKTYFTVVLSPTSSVNKVIHSNHLLCIPNLLFLFFHSFHISPNCLYSLMVFSHGCIVLQTQGFHTTSIHKLNDSTFRLVLLPYLSGLLTTSTPGFRADDTFGVQADDPMKVLKRTPVNVSHTNSKCWVTNFQLSDQTG